MGGWVISTCRLSSCQLRKSLKNGSFSFLYLLLRCFENICTTLFVRDKVVSWVIWCLFTPASSPYHCFYIHHPPQLSIHVISFSCSTRNSVIAHHENALSKSDKSYYICMIRRKRLFVKYEKYGTLSTYLQTFEISLKVKASQSFNKITFDKGRISILITLLCIALGVKSCIGLAPGLNLLCCCSKINFQISLP